MDEKKFEEILVKNLTQTEKKMEKIMDEKIETVLVKNLAETENRINSRMDERITTLERKMDQKYDLLEQKIIDNGFYFEHTYGEKISAIFDKLQLNNDLKQIEDAESKQIQKQIENNSAKLFSHEIRISKIEKEINSKKIKI